MSSTMTHINPIDRDALRQRVRSSSPVPNFCIDDFLEASFAERVLAANCLVEVEAAELRETVARRRRSGTELD